LELQSDVGLMRYSLPAVVDLLLPQ